MPSPEGPADPPLDAVHDDHAPDAESLERVARSLAEVAAGAADGAPDRTTEEPAGEAADDEPTDEAPTTDGAANDESIDAATDETPTDGAADDVSTAAGAPAETPPPDDGADEPPAPASSPIPASTPAPAPAPGPVATALADTRHSVEDLNDAERVFLAQQRALVAELCPDPQDPAAVGALFDRVRTQWAQATDRPDPRGPVDAFGVALGDLVRARLPELSWAVCSDRYGTEMVLARREPEMLVYPVAAVAQAWEDAREGWFVAHLDAVVRGIRPGAVVDD